MFKLPLLYGELELLAQSCAPSDIPAQEGTAQLLLLLLTSQPSPSQLPQGRAVGDSYL